MFKLIDRYIIKKFLGTFFYSILLIISIVIVFDLSEKIDDFLEKDIPINEIIFDYYVNFAPYYGNMFMFLFIFISVIFFTSKLANNSEIIAILSSGVSFRRMMFPYFVSALALAILSFALSSYVIPPANKVRLAFENKYINGTFYNDSRNIHKQIATGSFMYMSSYHTDSDMGYKFSLEQFNGKKLESKLISEYIKWDTLKNKWTINNYYIRYYGKFRDSIVTGRKLDTTLNIKPKDFKMRITAIETLNREQLQDFINEQKLQGTENINAALVEKYRRFAFSFASFILTLIGVSLSSRKIRGGIGMNIGIGIGLSFAYILFMQVSTQFAIGSSMPPLLSVWIPNLLFLIIGILLYNKAPK